MVETSSRIWAWSEEKIIRAVTTLMGSVKNRINCLSFDFGQVKGRSQTVPENKEAQIKRDQIRS